MLYTKKADFNSIAARYLISPVLARIIINRGVPEEDIGSFLSDGQDAYHDPHLLSDIDEAAEAVLSGIRDGKKVRIVGDYDIDGVCSTYILMTAAGRLGADVSYRIPDRVKDGYGINESIIREAHTDGIDIIITCDNGISATDALKLADDYDIEVIVTDHHEVPKEEGRDILPKAYSVTDPKRSDDRYPFKEICGGMVAYKFVQVLYEKAGIPKEESEKFIDFAAISTVGDIMPLKDENRAIVKEGLKRIAKTENIGLRNLVRICGLDIENLSAYSIGFVIGPCLNAGGRLETADIAIKLFGATSEEEAEGFARRLKELNDERKSITERYAAEGLKLSEERFGDDSVKVIYLPECHESVVGIIAGRIKEATNHPAIVLTDSEEEGMIKGSARSIENYNIFEKLSEVRELLQKFGGHPMAAGLTLRKADLERLRTELNQRSGLTEEDFVKKVWIDTELPLEYADETLCEQLKLLEPFGTGNEKPAFAMRDVVILSAKVLGKSHNVVKLRIKTATGMQGDAIIFTDGDKWLEEMNGRNLMNIIFYPQINEYMGRRTVQLVIKEWNFK